MTDKNNGGAAFPRPKYEPGMSLRDYFAGQALAGIASISADGFSLSEHDAASWAYQYADAMLKVRGAE